MQLNRFIKTLAALGLVTAAASSFAGRPLILDDAGINAKGEGHVETWFSRTDGISGFSVSPAYAVWDTVELAGVFTRFNQGGLTVTGVQAKWMITPASDKGCNFGTSFGAQRFKDDFDRVNVSFVNGLFSCNGNAFGNVHVNLGYAKPSGGSGETNYGIALEKSFGALTPHIEVFGSENVDTGVNIGLRGDITKSIQLDGSVGRQEGVNLYTVGLKFRF